MKTLLALLLLTIQLSPEPYKWVCSDSSLSIPEHIQGLYLKPHQLQELVVQCVAPQLPDDVQREREIIVTIYVDEKGVVQCARAATESLIFKRAAIEAALKWKFEPWKDNNKPVPFFSALKLLVTNNKEKAAKQCPINKRPG